MISILRRSASRILKDITNRRKIQTNPIENAEKLPSYLQLSDNFSEDSEKRRLFINEVVRDMTVHDGFLTEQEEDNILKEIEPYLKRMRYEFNHWDDAIHGFRETERLKWNETNTKIIDKIRSLAFSANTAQLKHVHILDLEEKGYIKPHIDSVRFCGNTIAGISLLSDSVMRLIHDKDKSVQFYVYLRRRSLYVMKDSARYDYTHEILNNESSYFNNEKVHKRRRISIMCRNEPTTCDT